MSQNGPNGSPPDLYAVPDTNIFIHFLFFNEIDWPKVLGAKHVCLVITPHLLRELDDIKDGMTRSGRRDVAQRVYRKIGELIEPEPLGQPFPLAGRAGTSLMYFERDTLDINPGLRSEKQDDALIAAVLHLQDELKNDGDTVVLLSDDLGCRQRAKGFGIRALTLSGDLKRPLPITEEEKRLKKYEQLEPQIQIDFGAEDGVLVLPYTARTDQLNNVRASYDSQIKNTIQALREDYAFYTNGDPRREPMTPFGDREVGYYVQRDQLLLLALKEIGVGIMADLLMPYPTARDYASNNVHSSVRLQFELWQRNVEQLYRLAKERRDALISATKELKLYLVSIILTHVGGNGIEDGQITMTLEQPFEFKMNKQWFPDHDPHRYDLDGTQWRSVADTPSTRESNPFKKSYNFGNFHPGRTLTCDPLYIYVNPELEVVRDGITSALTVEVSGLNVRLPISKIVTVQPV